ncbi:hypothetical protein POTOM_002511 [Populus tomentosa]|uniref:Uncharacterized protein n=1 Tax=Populus tomentosa TaxID=118781 RepID=A0A8X8IZ88_POPTO|nr:hypothetical protein POTOM_002511 [Populus tomentosa]
MINAHCGSMGSLKSENSCNKLQPTSPNESSSVTESKKTTQSFEFEQNSLTPPSLNLPAVNFELDGDVEVQSPDSSMWESFFTDNFDSDFKISSPVLRTSWMIFKEMGMEKDTNNNLRCHAAVEVQHNCLICQPQFLRCWIARRYRIPPDFVLDRGSEQDQDSGLQLLKLLLACAEAVSNEDYMLARRYLHHLNRVVSPLGDSMQRVASCFTEALSARLAATLTSKPSTSSSKAFSPFPPNSMEILKIYQILYQACPYVKFAHFSANQAIFEAFETEERVHVIDLDILQGYQWPAFMQALAARPGGAPFLRITGVGSSMENVRETGRCLTELAHSLHVPFEYHPVAEELVDLKPHMFNRRVVEALAVNSVNRLHRVPENCLGNLLAMIRDQAPNIVTVFEQEASHNGPYFLGRFLEALHYYSAIFDSLDATFPPDSSQRAKVEQYIFAPEIRNIVACEGAERFERHETLEKWRKLMEGKGFKGVPLSANAVTQSKILLGLYSSDGYRLTEDKGCLLLEWQDRTILAASAWRC